MQDKKVNQVPEKEKAQKKQDKKSMKDSMQLVITDNPI